MRNYAPLFADLPDQQAGRWQVYVKSRYGWAPLGLPAREAEARARVAELRAEGRLEQPHCLPV